MQTIIWGQLGSKEKALALARPDFADRDELSAEVARIIAGVRARGDAAVREFAARFDGADQPVARVRPAAFADAAAALPEDLKSAIAGALENLMAFHTVLRPKGREVETCPGVVCEKRVLPLEAVGLYVPGGTAPLPSSALMLGVPSALAGCPRRVLCTPPAADGLPDPAILYAASLTGIDEVYAIGGAQAVAAMAYGTESVPRVNRIFGPGNRWVTEAKQQVSRDANGAAIDMPAGPSEVMVIADAGAQPAHVAADLLSQAEHGPDSQVILVTTSAKLQKEAQRALDSTLALLPRRDVASEALARSRSVLVENLDAAIEVANAYAPEHLILQVTQPRELLPGIRNAGSVFLGRWTPESLGDYCSGTNHVLPTNGYARVLSGLSVGDFMREMTVQEATLEGLEAIGPWAISLARYEGLQAHADAVRLRLEAGRAEACA